MQNEPKAVQTWDSCIYTAEEQKEFFRDYLWPSLVFTSSDLLTAQIGLNSITSNDNTTMGQTLAVITLITIPVIIIYALFSKQIVEGVTSTGYKEGK